MNGPIERRDFFATLGLAAAAAAVLPACNGERRERRPPEGGEWEEVRRRLPIDREWIHMAGLLIAPHPQPVAAQVAEHRASLDANPGRFLERRNQELEQEVRRAAGRYLGVNAGDVALTDSTTMGIALVYHGMSIREGQEFLTTTHDYYSTHESLRFRAARSGATVRMIEPFASSASATADEITDRIITAITPATRALALTWVHSWTGVRIPARRIADRLAEVNADRGADDRVLFCLDGVHGLGVEADELPALGCDFFMAGTHKWLFAPRGTGILWGRPETQAAVTPTIPTFSDETGWGGVMTPGGFKAFEHRWAMAEAFDWHGALGRERVAQRIHALARQLREGLAAMDHVTLHTPLSDDVSAGIVSFEVAGLSGQQVVDRLERRRIVASAAPYEVPYARLTPGLMNDTSEIEETLAAVHALG